MSYDHGEGKWFEMLETGIKAPIFSRCRIKTARCTSRWISQQGNSVFLPKDEYAGCTIRPADIPQVPQFEEKGAVVLGISKDSSNHTNVLKKSTVCKITLLSDEKSETIKAYDVWKEKKSFGKTYMGVVRNDLSDWRERNDRQVKLIDKVKAAEDTKKWSKVN